MLAAPVPDRFLSCPKCQQPLAPESLAADSETMCPKCRVLLRAAIFPRFWQTPADPSARAAPAGEGEAACFFHPENRASISCESCGRFICSVCEFTLGTRHLCPSCLGAGLTARKLPEAKPWRFVWGQASAVCGWIPLLLGILLWPFFILTGSAAVFFAIYGWKRPGSLVRGNGRAWKIAGLIGGALQLGVWLAVAFLIFLRWNR